MHCAFKKHFQVKQVMYISMLLVKCNLNMSHTAFFHRKVADQRLKIFLCRIKTTFLTLFHFSISSQVKTHDQNACFQLRLKKYSSQKSICLGGESSNCKY